MSMHPGRIQELSDLVFHSLNQTITDEQFARLEYLLATDRAARAYYLEIVWVCVGLNEKEGISSLQAEMCETEEFDTILWQALAQEEMQARPVAAEKTDSQHPLVTNVRAYKKSLKTERHVSRPALWTAAISLAAMMMMMVYVVLVPQPSMEVATVVDTMHTQWAHAHTLKPGNRVATSREWMTLAQGVLKIETDTGVDVLIEAPAEFRFVSGNEIVMTYGRLFANVSPRGRDFIVTAPSSKVIDLGTQFGVQIHFDGQMELHVFQGSALILAAEQNRSRTPETVAAGQARRVDYHSRLIEEIPVEQHLFVRNFDSETKLLWRGQNLCLADMTGGGNGLGTGQPETGINPVTGRRGAYLSQDRRVPNRYLRTFSERYIDGVFVPNGKTPQIVSSHGHVFEECPETGGLFYSEIIHGAGAYLEDFSYGIPPGTLNGRVYGTPDNPSIFLHANLGITFDLDAIRKDFPDFGLCRFAAETGLSTAAPQDGNADIWVLVDGQVRFYQNGISEKGKAFPIDIELKPTDRFLTLVTTDGGDANRGTDRREPIASDWCVFVSPELRLPNTVEE